MLLSILIPTVHERDESFQLIRGQLLRQISRHGLANQAEVLSLADSGEESTSSRRNRLLERASGSFVAFADDDDEVSDDYVRRICEAIRSQPDVDCIGITGMVRFRGRYARRFVHSIRYREAFTRNSTYFCSPCHRNPIRREIALRYEFPNTGYGSSRARAMRMRDDAALRSEVLIESVLYHHQARRWWFCQWLLDQSEMMKQKLRRCLGRLSFETHVPGRTENS